MRVKLHIHEDNNINIGLDTDNFGNGYIVSVAKPQGVTMSATDVITLIGDVFTYTGATGSTTGSDAKIELLLGTASYVNETFPYKED